MKRVLENCGFTTVELLTAIALSFILISVAYGAYHFSFRYPRIWNDKINLENTGCLCMNRLSQDMLSAESIVWTGDTQLLLTSESQPAVVYETAGNALYRNGRILYETPVRLVRFVCEPAASIDQDRNGSFNTDEEPGQPDRPLRHIALSFADGKSTIDLESHVMPRNINEVRLLEASERSGF